MSRAPNLYPKRKTRVCDHCGAVVMWERYGSGAIRRYPKGTPRTDVRGRVVREYHYRTDHVCEGVLREREQMKRASEELNRSLAPILNRIARAMR